jgi:hypothetical protein
MNRDTRFFIFLKFPSKSQNPFYFYVFEKIGQGQALPLQNLLIPQAPVGACPCGRPEKKLMGIFHLHGNCKIKGIMIKPNLANKEA